MIADRKFQLIGPYADIHRDLMSHDADWRPTVIGDEEETDEDLPIYKISLEGPAGTGKTFFEGVLLEDLHLRYKRMRSVVIRKTRVSLTDSFMQVFEDDVLKADHPVISRKVMRSNRQEYRWTATVNDGGGVTRLAGMDNPTRLFSTQYDLIVVVEAIEFARDEYESLFRALRNTGAPFKAIILDTNPGNVSHWLNRLPDENGSDLRRVRTKHRHNPALVNPRTGKLTARGRQYMKILDQLTGVMRKRLRDGEWCSAMGSIYEHFSEEHHLIDPGKITKEKPWGENLPDFEYFILGVDFGWHDCKCVQVWGVVHNRDSVMVAEWYGTHVKREMLAKWVIEAHNEFNFVRGVADHDPEEISFLNEALGWRGGHKKGNLIQKAQKGRGSVLPGIELVIDLIGEPENGKPPKIRYSTKAGRYKCPELAAQSLPMGVVDEIPGYVWAEPKAGKPPKDEPDPGCVDHGCDVKRYVQTEIWMTDFRKRMGRLDAEDAFKPAELDNMTDEDFKSYVDEFAE